MGLRPGNKADSEYNYFISFMCQVRLLLIVCNFSFISVFVDMQCQACLFVCLFFFKWTEANSEYRLFDFLFHMQGHIKYELSWTFQSRFVLCHQPVIALMQNFNNCQA